MLKSIGGFEATTKSYSYQRAREQDQNLHDESSIEKDSILPHDHYGFIMPSEDCPPQWYDQWNSGRSKSHCFYSPSEADCPNL